MATKSQVCPESARETALTLTNDRAFYDAALPVIANLAEKVAAGKYDPAKAPRAFLHMIDRATQEKEWTVVYGEWRPNPASREAAAVLVLDHYRDQIREKAEELTGPEFLCVDVCNWAHDVNGNPIAQHHVYTSTEDGGRVRLLTPRKVRRSWVGYGDRLDGCPDALRKAGFRPNAYELIGTTGDRSEDSLIANYRRRPISV